MQTIQRRARSRRPFALAGVLSIAFAFSGFTGITTADPAGDTDPAGDNEFFANEIEPILKAHCIGCHGPEEQNGAFRADRLSSLLAGGDSGEPAVVPGNPGKSFLVKLIHRREPGIEMPPDEPLDDEAIKKIERWITAGATTPTHYGPASEGVTLDHWSFRPLSRNQAVDGIDDLIRQKLEEKNLEPSPQADRRVLIRRLYLVMLGIPPTPEQVQAFLSDDHPKAWQRLVEQVLASPHYGQRWASHWLDLVRFGETNGFETNRERPHAWRYRDWVIDAFNADMPYNDFVRQQIAGDALGHDVGTGFLVAGPRDIVKGQDPLLGQVQRMNELDDIINATGTAFLALSTGCARCHNHKFDPITQRDYYALQAVFAGVNHGDRALPISEPARKEISKLDAEIAELKSQLRPFLPRRSLASIAIDETDAQHAFAPQGKAAKVSTAKSDFGGEHYTWWKQRAGEDHVVYQPAVDGHFRVWLSWGAGYTTHSTDARYVIRSRSGDREIARVDQQRPANRLGEPDGTPKWSGFLDAGVHEFEAGDELVLIGGQTGSALTADVVVFQPSPKNEDRPAGPSSNSPPSIRPPSIRPSVQANKNVESFTPRLAKFIRFTIEKTNRGQACIDELEIFAGERNVALASAGARPSSSGDFVHPLHKLEHINDGQYGNRHSWIVSSDAGGWVQIELAEPTQIDRIVWARDRLNEYSDRIAIEYRIESATTLGQWSLLASSADRYPYQSDTPQTQTYQFEGHPNDQADRGREWFKRLQAAENRKKVLETTSMVYAGTFSQPGPTHRLYRGEPDARREQVSPDTIQAFASLELDESTPEQQRRLALADWIVSKENPLTPRVIVNRLWQFHFGTGIVDTPSDFGTNGSKPTHPELLDWLAGELVDRGWSLKHIHRLILNSETWQQSSRPRARALAIDANSRFLWRFPPRRSEAETIRDSMLTVSGVLDLTRFGGPGFSAFAVQMENVRHYHPKEDFGPEDWRRMIYMTKVRQEKDQVFGVFDCPDASMVVPKRSRSTTPLQALNLLNSRFVMQQAELFADRLKREHASDGERITRAWNLCFSRPPDEAELIDAKAFIEQHGWIQFARVLLNANEFVFIP